MNPFALTTTITALANLLASRCSPSELALLAATFTQLGDTLALIALQEELASEDSP